MWSPDLRDEYVTGKVERTSIPGEETASANAWQCEDLGYFRRQLGRMLGICISFMVLPITHSVLVSRTLCGQAFSSR